MLIKLLAAVAVCMVCVTVDQCLAIAAAQLSPSTPMTTITTNTTTRTGGGHHYYSDHHYQLNRNGRLVKRDAVDKCNETGINVHDCARKIWSTNQVTKRPTFGASGDDGGGSGGYGDGWKVLVNNRGSQGSEPSCCLYSQLYCSVKKVTLDDNVCAGDKPSETLVGIIDWSKIIMNSCQLNYNITPTEQLCKLLEGTGGDDWPQCIESAKYLCYGESQSPDNKPSTTDMPNPGSTGGSSSDNNSTKPPATDNPDPVSTDGPSDDSSPKPTATDNTNPGLTDGPSDEISSKPLTTDNPNPGSTDGPSDNTTPKPLATDNPNTGSTNSSSDNPNPNPPVTDNPNPGSTGGTSDDNTPKPPATDNPNPVSTDQPNDNSPKPSSTGNPNIGSTGGTSDKNIPNTPATDTTIHSGSHLKITIGGKSLAIVVCIVSTIVVIAMY